MGRKTNPITRIFPFTAIPAVWNMAGADYAIAVDAFAGIGGVFTLSWELAPTTDPLPVVLAEPISQTVTQGANATLSVSATGVGLNYQWFFNQVAIPGATTDTFVVANVQPAQVGYYTVTITNSSARGLAAGPAVLEL